MKWRPLYDVVWIERDAVVDEDSKRGRVVIPERYADRNGALATCTGTVIAVGPGRMLSDGRMAPLCIKPGDRVAYGRYAGQDLEIEGRMYFTIKEEDIRAVIPAKRVRRVA